MFMFLLVVFLLILVLGVLYTVVLRRASRESTAWLFMAQIGFRAGILAAMLTVLAAIISFTSFFDATPIRNLLGLAAFLGLPTALVGIGCGAIGLKSNAHRQAFVGLVLSGTSVVAWTTMATIAY